MSTLTNRTLQITTAKGYLPTESDLTNNTRESLAALCGFFSRCAGGLEPGSPGETVISMQQGSTDAALAAASGTVTFSGAAGTVGARIGGVLKTFAHGASDNADAISLRDAINADATLSPFVVATAATNVVTVTARQKGAIGNLLSLVASGTGVSVSGAALTGGVGGDGTGAVVNF